MWGGRGLLCPWRPGEGVGSPRTKVTSDCKPPLPECWELNTSPLQEQRGPLTTPTFKKKNHKNIAIKLTIEKQKETETQTTGS